MDFLQLVDSLTPEMYERLQTAVQIRRWPDGRRLTEEELASSMQAIIAYGEKRLATDQRVGFIDESGCSGDEVFEGFSTQEKPLNWR